MKKIAAIIVLLMNINANALTFESFKENLINDWNKTQDEELYLPIKTWHNREFYTSEKIASFNEIPLGVGYGKSFTDENKNWTGFYSMIFEDSHQQAEPMIGYAHTKNLYRKENLTLNGGYTLLVTARKDYDYIPIPFALPIASIGYKDLSINATYVPGGVGNGNVAFFWGVYKF